MGLFNDIYGSFVGLDYLTNGNVMLSVEMVFIMVMDGSYEEQW